jgi:hypothetical protein
MEVTVKVVDRGRPLVFSFEDVLRYHGGGSPGGAALAFTAMLYGLPLLDSGRPCERREILVTTPFGGPGARDAFELVTRAVTSDRYVVDPRLALPERGRTLERFVFRLSTNQRDVTMVLREGFVTDEFVDLARTEGRAPEQEHRLDHLKQELADRVMNAEASALYDATVRDR